jgi:autotransporter-associated beta strand protein
MMRLRHDSWALLACAFALWLTLLSASTIAAPLDPNAFTSLGTLDVTSGTLTINTDTLGITGAAAFTGVSMAQSGGPEIAVFTFDDIDIAAAVTITVSGIRPLAFLSQGDIVIDTTINLNGGDGGAYSGTMGGAGGLAGPAGGFAGGTGGSPIGSDDGAPGEGPGAGSGGLVRDEGLGGTIYEAGSGAGFGGSGGPGYEGSPVGGISYGDLLIHLQGGSGGGGGAHWSNVFPPSIGGNGGGGGGGAIEIGAAGNVTLATITAIGGSGIGDPSNDARSGGGGSGGGILVHGNSVDVTSGLIAGGGPSFSASTGGGGGGGGRVTVLGSSSHILGEPVPGINVNGSFGAGSGKAGVITLAPDLVIVPEGGSFVFTEPGIVFTGGTTSSDPTVEVILPRDLSVESGGQAALGASHVLTSGAQLTVEGTGVFDVSGFSQTLAAISGDGEIRIGGGGSLTVGDEDATSAFSGHIIGGGNLRKIGTGSLTLTGVNTYSGTTFVDQGILSLSNSLSSPGGPIEISSSGTVQANGIIQRSPIGTGTVAANGTLLIGDLSSTSGFDFDGDLEVGSQIVQLLDADAAHLGSQTMLAPGGRLVSWNGTVLEPGRTLSATGVAQINGPFTNNGAVAGPTAAGQFLTFTEDVNGPGSYTGNIRFSDGFSPGTSPALVAFENLSFDSTATLSIELGGLTPGTEHDQLSSTGTVNLAGILDVSCLDLGNSYIASPGDRFTIITAANPISGTFDLANLPATGGGRALTWLPVDYSDPNEVVLEIATAEFFDADFDEDTDVDADDLVKWEAGYGIGAGAVHMDGDADGNLAVDGADFLIWQQQFGLGVPLQAAATAVPEPASAMLLLFVASALGSRRARQELLHGRST